MPNKLAQESSPYLLQHANNPVDWYPWGEEALQKAKAEDKPIFLSVGYSACHWCHVMEHESFQNEEIAKVMNEQFVNVKVDREERPDLDQIYMTAVQLLTRHGGWPMSVFLTPDLQPFFGGTYWPPTRKPGMGMPGFDEILAAVQDAWTNRREQAIEQAGQLTDAIDSMSQLSAQQQGEPTEDLLDNASRSLERNFDPQFGGFGRAPKFPHPMDIRLLLRLWCRDQQPAQLEMATITLDRMASGGIYDQLGGGFHRYSVDDRWLVPHFEKMLYDNSLLTCCYVEAYQLTKNQDYARVVRETLDYLLREMTDEHGGFYSTQDADSEGVEGKFYVWKPEEVEQVLGAERAATFCKVYDVSAVGNFEEANILHLPKTWQQLAKIHGSEPDALRAEMDQCRAELLEVRNQRVWPGLDNKILTSWNALAIEAFALAAGALQEPKYLVAAKRATEFLLNELSNEQGRLLHTWREGTAKLDAYLDDYVYFINALITLYETSFETKFINEAIRLAELVMDQFYDSDNGGFFYTARDHEQLITRNKEAQDSSVPSSSAMAATVFLRLGKFTGRSAWLEAAATTIRLHMGLLQEYPTASGQLLMALDSQLGPFTEIVFAGKTRQEIQYFHAQAMQAFHPRRLFAFADQSSKPPAALTDLLAGPLAAEETPSLFVCEHFACSQPVVGEEAISSRLAELSFQATDGT